MISALRCAWGIIFRPVVIVFALIYQDERRQPSGVFLELICLTAIHVCS